ncbi:MAG: pentapeptide repeat-containing protein [Pikeienuella sp.]|uniref:pentapeptide repeat-containing protein n=1 Tax=Pikeienuella sp. TaxID=2831957 RepID=UPI0039193C90
MAQDDFPPFRIPALGRWIARALVTLVAGARALARSVRDAASARAGLIALRILVWPIRHHVLLLAAIAVLAFGGLWWALVGDMRALLSEAARSALDAEGEERRGAAYLVAAGAAALVALASAPFALLKAWVNERATRTAEDKHLTERIMRAVEQLGAEKTVKKVVETEEIVDGELIAKAETLETTEPNLEVRLGAIYALERIAQDSERDHIPIMETLCAYVRENSNARTPQTHDLPDWEVLALDTTKEGIEQHEHEREERFSVSGAFYGKAAQWAYSLPAPRADVQAALTVIGRRSALRRAHEAAREYQIDLRRANLQKANLSFAALENTLFADARLEGADFTGAQLENADFFGARMDGATFIDASLENADLSEVSTEGADLMYARMNRAALWGNTILGARLLYSKFHGSKFGDVVFYCCDLSKSELTGADLTRSVFLNCNVSQVQFARSNARSADFTGANGLSQEQVNSLFGDRSTILPTGVRRTDLMDREPLDRPYFPDPNYEAWLAAGAPPGNPLP